MIRGEVSGGTNLNEAVQGPGRKASGRGFQHYENWGGTGRVKRGSHRKRKGARKGARKKKKWQKNWGNNLIFTPRWGKEWGKRNGESWGRGGLEGWTQRTVREGGRTQTRRADRQEQAHYYQEKGTSPAGKKFRAQRRGKKTRGKCTKAEGGGRKTVCHFKGASRGGRKGGGAAKGGNGVSIQTGRAKGSFLGRVLLPQEENPSNSRNSEGVNDGEDGEKTVAIGIGTGLSKNCYQKDQEREGQRKGRAFKWGVGGPIEEIGQKN